MDATKRKRLKEAGWRTGSVAEFLALTPEESGLIEIKLRLVRASFASGATRKDLARAIASASTA